jgi:uncharacterized membrane protein
MWFFLSVLSAVFYSFRGILEKQTIKHVDIYILGLAVRLFALPFFILPFLIKPELAQGFSQTNTSFWLAIFMVCFVNTPIEAFFYYRALRDEELTTVLPILSLSPIVTLLVGTIAFKEIPSVYGLLGVLLIVVGIYAIKIKHAKEGLLEPFKHIGKNKGVQCMFIVMLSQSLGIIFDKIGVKNSNAYVYAFFDYVFVCIPLFVMAYVKSRKHLYQLKTHWKSFLPIGIIVSTYTLLYLAALEVGFAAYVSAIKNSYILFAILLGVFFLKETEGKQKIFAGIIIVCGLALIKLFT